MTHTPATQRHNQPGQPYTDTDLRTEAARQHAVLTEDPDFMGVGEQMESRDVTPDGGVAWDDFSDDTFDAARRSIHDLINGAADVSAWAVELGADGLEPSTDAITLDAGQPVARIHFAFSPTMPEEIRTACVEGIKEAIDAADATLDEEDGDSDSDVFELISTIASRLRDATDEGEHHAVGLIADLANGRTTVAQARADLSEITFRHV